MNQETRVLYKIKKFLGYGSLEDKELLSSIIETISNKKCISGECPDIRGGNFGIEHTKVSPFLRSKKGDNFKRFDSLMKESLRKIDLPYFEYYYLDIELFTKKLGIEKNSNFAKNISESILEKSKKFKKYEKFEINGLWLEVPEYLFFFEKETLLYLIQDDIYNSIIESPFDFFLFGNESITHVFTKNELLRLYKNNTSINRFLVTAIEHFPFFQIKCKEIIQELKEQDVKMGCDEAQIIRISNDMYIPHSKKMFIVFGIDDNKQFSNAKLFSDNIELKVDSWSMKENTFIINFALDLVQGVLETDFKHMSNLNFKINLEAGESINFQKTDYKDSIKQKIFTATKRFFLYNESKYEIYISPSNYGSIVKPTIQQVN